MVNSALQQPRTMNMSEIVIKPDIEESWGNLLVDEFNAPSFIDLKSFLMEERKQHVVYPNGRHIFEAFNRTPVDRVNVVILGQDPYHGPGQAHGLCFSVQDGIKPPPSLVNIFKELNQDLGMSIPPGGNLSKWADQGVLLLNATLTVRARTAGSHQNKGWEPFTDAVIRKLSEQRDHVVFLLWGRYARNKAELIDRNRHCVLEAAHPSPFSAHSGFFGCRHFSKANAYLESHGRQPVDWTL